MRPAVIEAWTSK